jgi:hypothetical protein
VKGSKTVTGQVIGYSPREKVVAFSVAGLPSRFLLIHVDQAKVTGAASVAAIGADRTVIVSYLETTVEGMASYQAVTLTVQQPPPTTVRPGATTNSSNGSGFGKDKQGGEGDRNARTSTTR